MHERVPMLAHGAAHGQLAAMWSLLALLEHLMLTGRLQSA